MRGERPHSHAPHTRIQSKISTHLTLPLTLYLCPVKKRNLVIDDLRSALEVAKKREESLADQLQRKESDFETLETIIETKTRIIQVSTHTLAHTHTHVRARGYTSL